MARCAVKEFLHMPILKRLFGLEDNKASRRGSGPIAARNTTSGQLVKLPAGQPSSLSSITAALLRPPLDGAALLDDIVAALCRQNVLPDGGAEILALFVLHAHAHGAATISPLLVLTSPDIACGKTTALTVLQHLTPQPLLISDLTPAGLYRTIAKCKYTLLIDEAEAVLLASKALRSLLNSGHRRDGARVLRADGVFDLFCPKIVALLGELPPSLRDRAIVVGLKRKRPGETVAPLDEPAIARLKALAEQAARWADQQFEQLAAANPELPACVTNRTADNWRILLAIADAAGGRWPELARALAVRAAADTEATLSPGLLLLTDLRDLFGTLKTDRLATSEIIEWLPDREDRPWANYHRGRPVSAHDVARLLRPFGIQPKTLRFEGSTAKGYSLEDCQDAFERYLARR